ncbi:unnamed protein product [Cuscuta epithymum]|uniref:Uncharacterized protein n=1 Tax=Cuscuta epithymum TaxID=186058 RepID=A0AAV0EAE7_9ASTE|nr:unnamed protein product [Cuscuta epithymum]CAH9130286.1 unnamed protein product [Cuscuta epithymum]
MVMDHPLRSLPNSSMNSFELENEIIFSTFKPSVDIPDSYKHALSVAQHPNLGTHDPALDSDSTLNYISQMLLEEESIDGNNQNMSFDPIALRAAENAFYEALHENPSPPIHNIPGSLFRNDVDPGECESCVTSEPPPDLAIKLSSGLSNGSLYSFGDSDSISRFMRGAAESSRCLQAAPKQHIINDLEKHEESPRDIDVPKIDKDRSVNSYRRGKKHYYHPDESGVEEERINKQPALCKEEVELSEDFDNVLLCGEDDDGDDSASLSRLGQKGQSGRRHLKKRGGNCETVDLVSLLISCAQSVAYADYRGAEDKLKKIRQHSSPTGDPNQRVANVFADSLEVRLAGTGTQVYKAMSNNDVLVPELLKSYLSPLPFMRMAVFFANRMIYEVASKCVSLHIIDFGIHYGIQWPTLIRDLSQRPDGPPKLRITGIEIPLPGFCPEQMVEETGSRLAKCCQCFGVPFEYNALTRQNWETITIEDLKLLSDEVVAVNCFIRLEYILDETLVVMNSPRDAVLNLIRQVSPRIYVQAMSNGPHSSPFFVNRFREALSFYSTVFDTCVAILPLHEHHRLILEQEVLGREIMNIIACEGMERLLRPETCKQWQSRILRAGFKPMSTNPKLVKKLKSKVRAGYHKDFLFVEEGNWILQGWKGRILGGSSCWVAA